MRDDRGFHVDLARRLAAGARHVPFETALHGAALTAVWQVANAAGWAEAATSEGTQRIARQVSLRGTEPV